MSEWKFLTNHAAVLACIANEPAIRVRDIATCVGVTERAANRIVNELEAAGYLTRHRVGARNTYELHPKLPLRHPIAGDHSVGELLALLVDHPIGEPSGAEQTKRFARDAGVTSSSPAAPGSRPQPPSISAAIPRGGGR